MAHHTEEEESKPTPVVVDMLEFDSKSIEQFAFDDEEDTDLLNGSDCKAMITRFKGLKVVYLIKGGSVIYVMISKNKNDSVTFMKKQLATLHTILVSMATKQFITILKQNSCYDIMADPSIYR